MRKINEDPKFYEVQQYLYKQQFKYLGDLLRNHGIEDDEFCKAVKIHRNTMRGWERLDNQPRADIARRIWEFFRDKEIDCDLKLLRFNPQQVKRQLRFSDLDEEQFLSINGRFIRVGMKDGQIISVAAGVEPRQIN